MNMTNKFKYVPLILQKMKKPCSTAIFWQFQLSTRNSDFMFTFFHDQNNFHITYYFEP